MDTTLNIASPLRAVLRPLIRARSYSALTHNLLGLPLGAVYFTWLVTGLTAGLGLAITLVGIPVLTAVLASVRPLLAAERGLANTLLDAGIRSAPLTPGGEGLIGRFKAYWTDSATWRGMAYLVARFPVGLATFVVAATAWSSALYLIAAPIVAPFDAIELGFWRPDTVLDGLALVPLGLVLLVAAGWISDGLAWISRELARWGAR